MTRGIVQLINSAQRRGAETFGTQLHVALERMGRAIRTVALSPATENPLDCEVLAPSGTPAWTLVVRARQQVRGASVVVAHGSRTLPVSACATVGLDLPFVYRNIGDPRFWVSSRSRRLRVTAMLRRAAAVAVLWPQAASDIERFHGIPTSKLRVIPNAVSVDGFGPVTEEERHVARMRFGLDPDAVVVAYIGSLSYEKAPQVAAAAVRALPGARLLVAGDGPMRPGLERGGDDVVVVLGQVSKPATVLAAADALVLTSLTEGLPAVLIEAGLRGIPVVATDVGGVREIVEDGVTGVLSPPGDLGSIIDGLKRVLDAGSDMGLAARQRCLERFTMTAVAPLWDELLSDVQTDR